MAEYIQLLRFRGHRLTSALFSMYNLVDSFMAVTLHISKIYLCKLYKYTLSITVIMGNLLVEAHNHRLVTPMWNYSNIWGFPSLIFILKIAKVVWLNISKAK